ncbi:Hsp33 family molecular chaperone HslO [Anaerosinus gibii]|uniref:33 kDa chaperonin n=1 Tax=Selenobaculum gibii TaxID=3054208 RepID=A0A9Y2ES25_9FIRM|nr:Hsp33 family molecular chaperone HslO [Selenobaculum gbiensis]WIW71852.1 Hsp33 family molecular chaperone HslO [Selenobaculum gbiensis]
MKNHLVKATANGIRIFAAVTTQLVDEASKRHECYPLAAAALGRTMTGALLLAANLKTEECITLKIQGDGPLGKIVADANADGFVRGYVDYPQVNLPLKNGKLDVGAGVGQGTISVTRFTGLKQPFTGSAELITGEIAEDITQYLMVSEQTPSSVGLGVLVSPELDVLAAGGFFIQALPNIEPESIDKLEMNLKNLDPVSKMIKDGMNAKDIIRAVFKGMEVTFHTESELQFVCQCSGEKIEEVLISLGESELKSLIEEEKAEIICHFCGEKYEFSKDDLEKILLKMKKV